MVKSAMKTLLLIIGLIGLVSATAFAQGTAFTYQGRLADNGAGANGNYDLQFKLFDTATVGTGTQQGSTLTLSNVAVSAAIFTVSLDFGVCASCFNGAPRYLEIGVKPTSGSTFTTLAPRQPITSTPYALKSQNATTATTADGLSVACVNCVTSSQIGSVNGSAVSGTIPVASVPVGSSNYIQNGTSQQPNSNFRISGDGTAAGTLSANILNAGIGYDINGLRVFTVNGPLSGSQSFTASNTFAGDGAGVNTTPSSTLSSSSGKLNSFFGAGAGQANTTGQANAFFGNAAGFSNTLGLDNAFFGRDAGFSNTIGSNNAFFGRVAGRANTTGGFNAFVGNAAGLVNSTGSNNTFFGASAGNSNTTGSQNTFIGFATGFTNNNPNGDNNTLLGGAAKVTSGVSNGTAIGNLASVTQSNSLILGSINGVNTATADTRVGIGTTAPAALLDVQSDGATIPQTALFTTYSGNNEIIGRASGGTRATPAATPSGVSLLLLGGIGHNSTGFTSSPGASINIEATEPWTPTANGTRIRFRTTANSSTAIASRMTINQDGNVGIGTLTPQDLLQVNGDIRVGSGTTGCVKDGNGTIIAGTCSSDARLKRDTTPFPHLLDKLVQLQPVHFYWRAEEFKGRHFGTRQSFGLIAQEVEQVMPELVTEDEQGFKAVNYAKLPLLTLQAVKELKAENDGLRQQLKQQQTALEGLKKIVCLDHPNAEMCK